MVAPPATAHPAQATAPTTSDTAASPALVLLQAPAIAPPPVEIDKDGPGTFSGPVAPSGYPITPGAVVIISDVTVGNDLSSLTAVSPPGTSILPAISQWPQVTNALNHVNPGSIPQLVFSGHGLGGTDYPNSVGVQSTGGQFDLANPPASVVTAVNTALPPGAPILILGCTQGGQTGPLLDAATAFNHPIIANLGNVTSGNLGLGGWVIAYPPCLAGSPPGAVPYFPPFYPGGVVPTSPPTSF